MRIFILLLISLSFFSCKEYDYYESVKEEMAKNIRNDSLFYGYYFGMPRQDFYDYSWKMNKEKMFTQGEYNQSIQHQFQYENKTVRMNFFPQFENEEVAHMTVVYSYPAWAPWSKNLWSDKLILRVRDLLEDEQNAVFHLIKDDNGTPGFVAVKANRRILITIKDDEQVWVLFTDMTKLEDPLADLVLNKKYE